MRLSESIRLGSMLKPQDYEYFRGDRTCALGAACDALGIPEDKDYDYMVSSRDYHKLTNEYPHLHRAARCPACLPIQGFWRRLRRHEYDLGDVVVHLNDDHQWTRERIADWVATVEPSSDSGEADASPLERSAVPAAQAEMLQEK